MKGGRTTIPKKVREKLSVKDGDFLTYLLTRIAPFCVKRKLG
jgi:bifunctional DNA-binding transcriptional regulator/antitoxin component of YhaV-PrlF toxin-antitoxin module